MQNDFKSKQIELSEAVKSSIQTGFQFRAKAQQQSKPQTSYNLVQIKNTARGILHYINPKQGTISIPESKKNLCQSIFFKKMMFYIFQNSIPAHLDTKAPVKP